VTRPRAADDFATIRERLKELRQETAAAPPASDDSSAHADALPNDHDRRLEERREGLPPPWAPTIFVKNPAAAGNPSAVKSPVASGMSASAGEFVGTSARLNST
jgi:hypothetical protein